MDSLNCNLLRKLEHNTFISKALETITGYLDLEDLLQVRYLNTAWNEAAKRHLRKHYFNLNREEDDVIELSDLIRKANRNSFSTPFQKLNINFLKLNYHLQRFLNHYGSSFVAYRIEFSYHGWSPAPTKTMIHILNKSPNLKMLEFGDIFKTEFKILNPKFDLPKLTSLKFSSLPKKSGTFLKAILEASPSLKFLKICEIEVEMTSLISVLANRNIKIEMEKIYPSSLPENSLFNGNSPIYLTSVSFSMAYFNKNFSVFNIYMVSKLSEFIQQYSHTIKYLEIQYLNSKQDIHFPTMTALETLFLNYHLHAERPQHLAKFNRGQFPSLKKLKLELNESWEFITHFIDSEIPLENVFMIVSFRDEAELNALADSVSKFLAAHSQKLKQLELIFGSRGGGPVNASPGLIRLPVDLPALEFLQVRTNLRKTFHFGKTENVRKLMMHYGFEYNQLQFQFPNLKSLYIKLDIMVEMGTEFENFYKLYQNPTGIEELTLELDSYYEITVLIWKLLTGLTADKEFVLEAMNMVDSKDLSLAKDLLKDSKPNIGNMTALQTLNINGDGENDSMAIMFLIFSGMFKNLRKYRTTADFYYYTFDDVLSSNNTQFFVVNEEKEDDFFLEPFTKYDPRTLEVGTTSV